MTLLPRNLYSVASIRDMDRSEIATGVAGYTLMTRAGEAAFRIVSEKWPSAKRWQVVCGPGNNAGDGYVVALLAAKKGLAVEVVSLVDPLQLTGDAARAKSDFVAAGGTIKQWDESLDANADLLVDALLGRGALRDVDGTFADAVAALNAHSATTISLDIPSGLDGDSGAVRGCAVRAAMTVAFVGLSPGLFLNAAPDHVGELCVSDLDVSATTQAAAKPEFQRVTHRLRQHWLKPRPRDAHKGDFGHVLIVGGGPGMPGAARLCGEAALRAGAGRVSVATHHSHTAVICSMRPELMVHGIESAAALRPLLDAADVVAFGPGLGQCDWARAIYAEVASDQSPAVWDADALNYLAKQPLINSCRIITPHPGEAATLLGMTSRDIQSNRRAGLMALQKTYGGCVVLKGSGSLVSSTSGTPWLEIAGNPGMAAAGMGDVLTGVIAALLAQGLSYEEAAAMGVSVHAMAGDRAARDGERGLLASEVLSCLRPIMNHRC